MATYYAIRIGNSAIIRRAVKKPKRVVSVITVARRPNSPRYDEDGNLFNGTKLQQISYTGGTTIATVPYSKLSWHGILVPNNGCLALTRTHRQLIADIIDSYSNGDVE